MIASKYQLEINSFRSNFEAYKNKRIAIYGIGRRTATLLPGITDFQIVGLLDYDINNIGKSICNIKIISMEEAEKKAELIIINSDPSNYQIIYRRMLSASIPIFYGNGERAEIVEVDNSDNEYWNSTFELLKSSIETHDIISFDFFDTLVMRKVLSPTDIFRLVEKRAKDEQLIPAELDFAQIRQQIFSGITDIEPTFNMIYTKINDCLCLDQLKIKKLMKLELNIEKAACVPRKKMIEALQYAQSIGKKVYIISDTYFRNNQLAILLEESDLGDFPIDHCILSSECQKCKRDGSLWKMFQENNAGKRILHIGDNQISDIQMPQLYGIDTFYIMSGKKMLESSNVYSVLAGVHTLSDCVHIGLIIARLFHDPFALSETKGKVKFLTPEDFGYVVFGGVICRFLMWLHDNLLNNNFKRVLFFARDGYFLLQDYEHLSKTFNLAMFESKYVLLSRRLLYLVTMQTDQDLMSAASFPFAGSFSDYLKSRFNIAITESQSEQLQMNDIQNDGQLWEMISPYKKEIFNEAKKERENYFRYLNSEGILRNGLKTAVVDLGFYGTNQHFFQKVIGECVVGYYFSACYDEKNEFLRTCKFYGCFNDQTDPRAEQSYIKRKNAFLESFLTAPYGMIRYIDDKGNMICEKDKSNQKNFSIKQRVNDGVKEYMTEFSNLYGFQGGSGICGNEAYTYYAILGNGTTVDYSIQEGFYFDNDMAGTREVLLEF